MHFSSTYAKYVTICLLTVRSHLLHILERLVMQVQESLYFSLEMFYGSFTNFILYTCYDCIYTARLVEFIFAREKCRILFLNKSLSA
jgi:hypothetical protein